MASLKGRIFEIRGFVFILFFSINLKTGSNCPHLEPKTVISSITTEAKFKPSFAAIVLFKTSIPLGFTKLKDVSNPPTEPVASTTIS